MRTISNSEFLAHPEMYLDLARRQDLKIRYGNEVLSLSRDFDTDEVPRELTDDEVWGVFAKHYPDGLPPLLSDEEEIARAITFDELLVGVKEDLREIFSKGQRDRQ